MRVRRKTETNAPAEGAVDDFWLPTSGGSIGARWFWPSSGLDSDTIGVLLVPSIAHEEQTTAVGLVALGHELAAHGMPTLSIDVTGTAQGSGSLATPDIGERWDDDIRTAVRHLRECGLQHIAVIGFRLGALLAAHALVEDPVDLMVMWAPALSGRRFARELKIMQAGASGVVGDALPGVTVAGFNFPPPLVDYLKSLDIAGLEGKPASRLLLVDTAERLSAVTDDLTLFDAIPVDRLESPETDNWLFCPADMNGLPSRDLQRVREQISGILPRGPRLAETDRIPAPVAADLSERRTQVIDHNGIPIRETIVEFGDTMWSGAGRLVGILSEPADGVSTGSAFVAVTGVGPGRVFVDLARRESALGRTCLRFELSGFGTSSRRPGEAWADYYHPTASADIAAAVDHLVSMGHDRITIVGFCAGVWSALQMAPRPEVVGIVGLNIQLFIRARLLRRQVWPDQRLGQRLWARAAQSRFLQRALDKVEREHPIPSPPVRWIGRHVAAGTAVTLIFSDDDLGLEYYRKRAHWPGGIRSHGRRPDVRSHPGLGHLPSGPAREQMLADIHELSN